ncbi:hypothetical protein AAFF_G00327480 [Aldrovandia affinis]|uniref:Uncharacterized protein n=1 Tax=Aldrovandia affinis TaxID=143900 RepID=A0AAD7T9H6_9TELE|nr:hypothetical protein AAFF_G00327480 [Aldrovandia affinis]
MEAAGITVPSQALIHSFTPGTQVAHALAVPTRRSVDMVVLQTTDPFLREVRMPLGESRCSSYYCPMHQSTQHSPYELMFGQKPQLLVDYLLGVADGEPIDGTPEDWVARHKERLATVYTSAKRRLEAAAAYRGQH